jgi:hypothetical protein
MPVTGELAFRSPAAAFFLCLTMYIHCAQLIHDLRMGPGQSGSES